MRYGRIDLVKKYGGGHRWFEAWADAKLEQLKEMGFNTLGAWHEKYYWGNNFPKTIEIRMSQHAAKANLGWGAGFPDVFDKSFEESVHRALIDHFHGKGQLLLEDESVIGYFTDNELHWWGSGGRWGQNDPGEKNNDTSLVNDYIYLPEHAAGKRAWVDFIRKRYGDIEALNRAWNCEYSDFDDLLYIGNYRAEGEAFEADKLEFLRIIAETYFKTTSSLLKQYAPNHMNLGCRMVGTSTPDVVLEVMKKYVDVISLNFYSFDLPRRWLEHVHELTGKPIMITEFSFCSGSRDGFLYNTNGAQNVIVRNQKRRGECYRNFLEQAYEMPFIIGMHWFALYDYDSKGGLLGNYGLLDLEDKPWEEFTAEVTKVNREILEKHER